MSIRLFHVDAFASRPFSGNPAVVCPLDKPVDAGWMQQVAAEMNVSETAFLHPEGDGYRLRWFTPTMEMDLCGHATLASAHVLWEQGLLDTGAAARFQTLSGTLTVVRRGGWLDMDFPTRPVEPTAAPPGLTDALGEDAVFVGRTANDYVVELRSADAVRNLRPDLASLERVEARGVAVTAPSDDARYDFVSRFFAPRSGIPEDPVTGSAHCALGPYWQAKLGKDEAHRLPGLAQGRRGARQARTRPHHNQRTSRHHDGGRGCANSDAALKSPSNGTENHEHDSLRRCVYSRV